MDVAYLVSCEKYKFGINVLNGPSNDLRVMYEVFSSYCGILKNNITCFCDGEVSDNIKINSKIILPWRDEILSKLYEDSQIHKEEAIDNLFFYYSGHGYVNFNNNFCIIPTNSNAAYLDSYAITDNLLAEHLMAFRAKHIILIFDACQTVCREKSVNEIKKLPNSIVTFYSSTMGNKSYISPNTNISVFTMCLSQALSEDGKCRTVGEVSDYLDKHLGQLCIECNIYDIQTSQIKVEDISLRNIVLSKIQHEYISDFTSDEIKIINDFAEKIDVSNTIFVSQYAEGSLRKIKDYIDSIPRLENDPATKEMRQWFSDFFFEFGKSSQANFFLLRWIEKLQYKEEKKAYNEEQLKKFFERFDDLKVAIYKNIDVYDKKMNMIANYVKELTMYIAAGNLACRINVDQKNSDFLKKRLEIIINSKSIAEENIKLLNKVISVNKELYIYCDKLQLIFSKFNSKINNTTKEELEYSKDIWTEFYQDICILHKEIKLITGE